jgi:hypothetical protein
MLEAANAPNNRAARRAMRSSKYAHIATACTLHARCSQMRKQPAAPCPSFNSCHSKVNSQKKATASRCAAVWEMLLPTVASLS